MSAATATRAPAAAREPEGADASPGLPAEVEIAIVGTGFSGIAMAAALRRSGRRDFVVLERAHDVGGTWRENTYPGCRCDVPSHVYSFSFAPNPEWSSTFSPQPEIRDYIRRVAAEQGVLPHVRFGCEVQGARWEPEAKRWLVATSAGALSARFLIAGAGPLHEPKLPDIPGLAGFEGTMFHSATWDHSHRLEGERVAVIGTGASAIQFIPQIQPKVERLFVFQRTPAWIMPRTDRRLTRLERAIYRRLPAAQRAIRGAIYWARELIAIPMLRATLAPVLRQVGIRHLRLQVRDPELRTKLTPDYLPGCKRILVANDYLPAMGKPNVELVCDGVVEVRGRSIVTAGGAEHEVDTIILGTGFHVTDILVAERIRGADGTALADVWDGSPQAHRGTTVAGFPNLFFLLGPNTGLGHNSVVFMAEAQARYVVQALDHVRAHGLATVAPRPEAQRAWNAELQRRMKGTVWLEGGCASWYIDRNGLNTTLWPDFSFRFARALSRFDPAEHEVSRERSTVGAAVA
jgi:cation diffusion facilitator CzcD-associated flavoprotein CzcO